MTLEEAIKRYTSNAFYEKSDGNLQGHLEFNQLAEWLKDYKRLLEQESSTDTVNKQRLIDEIDRHQYSKEFCKEHNIDNSINLGMVHIIVNELLSNTQIKACEDAINRQAVLDTICKVCEVETKPSKCNYRKGLFGGCKEYEAIKELKTFKTMALSESGKKAIDTAIEALEQKSYYQLTKEAAERM